MAGFFVSKLNTVRLIFHFSLFTLQFHGVEGKLQVVSCKTTHINRGGKMNKKAIIAVLSALVLTVVASVTLILTVGQKANADSEPTVGVLDKEEYFYIDDGHLSTLSDIGMEYAGQFDFLKVIIPNNVTEISGNVFYYGGFSFYSIFSANIGAGGFPVDYSDKVVEIILPDTLESITSCSFSGCSALKCIRIPASVKDINKTKIYQNPDSYSLFNGCDNLTKIYCECSKEYANEHWNEHWNEIYADVYDEEQDDWVDIYKTINTVWDCNKTITFDVDGGNETIDNQTVCVDSLVTKPTDPTKDGYTFKGWFIGDDEYDFATPVTADMTLTAQWEAISEQPEPSNPEQPTTPENPEQPTTPDTDTETVTVGSKNGFNLGAAIGGGLVTGLGSISAIAATVIVRRRHK